MRNLKPIDYTSKAIAYFLELNERKLTEDIIMPLLKTMGFIRVDYHGGQCEKGKDLILWRNDELDEIELINVQVKIWKPSPSSSNTQSFAGVVTQLQQASEEHVEHLNGQKYCLPQCIL